MALDSATAYSADDVDFGTLGSHNLDPCTVVLWDVADSYNTNHGLWAKDEAASPFRRFICQIRNTETFRVQRSGTVMLSYVANNNTLPTAGTVFFLAVVYDTAASAGQKVRAYVGTLTSKPTAVTWASTADGSGLDSVASFNFRALTGNGVDEAQDGRMENIAVIPSALDATQVLAIYEGGVIETTQAHSPVLRSPLGYAGAAVAPDWSGNDYHGTVSGLTFASSIVPREWRWTRDQVGPIDYVHSGYPEALFWRRRPPMRLVTW